MSALDASGAMDAMPEVDETRDERFPLTDEPAEIEEVPEEQTGIGVINRDREAALALMSRYRRGESNLSSAEQRHLFDTMGRWVDEYKQCARLPHLVNEATQILEAIRDTFDDLPMKTIGVGRGEDTSYLPNDAYKSLESKVSAS